MQTFTTGIIAGHKVTLEDGQWYIATRPMMRNRRQRVFPVSIWTQIGANDPVDIIDGLTYDQANEFLNQFNNGKTSFDGRVW